MNTPDSGKAGALRCAFLLATAIALQAGTARAQYFFLANNHAGTVGEYSTSGTPLNASLIAGLNSPTALAVAGNDLYVAGYGGSVGEYTTSGATVNASLITGLYEPVAMTVAGNNLFVLSEGGAVSEYSLNGTLLHFALIMASGNTYGLAATGNNLFIASSSDNNVSQYTTSGTLVNPSLVGAHAPVALVVSGNYLYVSTEDGIAKYTTSGSVVNASLVPGVGDVFGMDVSGNDLFVANYLAGTVGEYTTDGATVNASLVTGFGAYAVWGLVVVPEPSTLALTAIGMGALLFWRPRSRMAG